MNPKWLMLVIALACAPALACNSDVDCDIGAKCMKQPGQSEGSCSNSRKKGYPDDGGMSRNATDPFRSSGPNCDIDSDCGPLGKCVRVSGQIHRTCAGGSPMNVH